MKKKKNKIFFIFIALVVPQFVVSSTDDYVYRFNEVPSYSNYGTIGLIQMPSARMMPAGSLGVSWSNSDPYLTGSILAYPFDWFEASFQYTDINNAFYSDVASFSGSQSYKDKGFDIKLNLFKEGNFMPETSIGIRDIAGTAVFGAEYIAFSKKITTNLDFTFGIGWGNLNGNPIENPLKFIDTRFENRAFRDGSTQGGELSPKRYFTGNAGTFGGIEYIFKNMNGLRLKIEYDGTNYKTEGFPFGKQSFSFAYKSVKQPEKDFNFGIVYPVNEFLQFKLSYIKGNTLNFGFSIAGNLGSKRKKLVKANKPTQVIISEEFKNSNIDQEKLFKTALVALKSQNILLQNAGLEGNKLKINIAQSTYQSYPRTIGRTSLTLDAIAPDSIEIFEISNENAGMQMYKASVNRTVFNTFKEDNFYKLASREIELSPSISSEKEYQFNPKILYPEAFWSLSPDLRTQVGGPDGFFLADLRLNLSGEIIFQKGFNFLVAGSIGIYDGFKDLKYNPDSILPHVRTDAVLYLKNSRDYAITRMQANRFKKLSKNVFSKVSLGILEEMFGGYGGEVLYRPFDKNYAVGFELWNLKQRDFNQNFKFQDYEVLSGHVNMFYLEPKSQVLLTLRGGRFLAKDSGFNLDFSRRFKSGLRMGAFFAFTDISEVEFGEGSFDKGFYFHIPMEIFLGNYSTKNYENGIRPITRDGAATLSNAQWLWGLTDRAQAVNFSRDWDDLYE
jgi:hypothetical protein